MKTAIIVTGETASGQQILQGRLSHLGVDRVQVNQFCSTVSEIVSKCVSIDSDLVVVEIEGIIDFSIQELWLALKNNKITAIHAETKYIKRKGSEQ